MTADPEIEAAVLAELEDREAMLALLSELVNTDSPSRDKAAVDAAGAVLKTFYERDGIAVDTVPHDTFGDALKVSVPSSSGSNQPPILLMGHRDTVFPKGEAARRPFRIEGGRAYGPGVGDMKGGLVVNAFVLRAFHRAGGASVPLAGLVTSDEEIGSPSSRPVIEREAAAARVVFNSEPARPNGNVVTGRKGGVFLRFDVTGKAAHSGAALTDGISAIEEAAHKVLALHGLRDAERGTSVNVGVIGGGEVLNMVAPTAWGEMDMRYVRSEDRGRLLGAIEEIMARECVAGAKSALTITGEFLPFEQSAASRELFGAYQAAAAEAGFEVQGDFSGGCADSGFAASTGTPTLCGTGPVGGKFHTPDEFLEIDTLVPRAKALALAILRTAAE